MATYASKVRKDSTDPTHSTDAVTIARALSDIQLAEMEKSGRRIVAENLKDLREVMWGDPKKPYKNLNETQRQWLVDSIIKKLPENQKNTFLESYARMGNLYEMASMSAISNYLHDLSKNPDTVPPGGVEEFAKEYFGKSENSGKTVTDFIAAINKPVFEMTFTAHPTNVYSIEAMRAYRNIAKILHDKMPITVDAAGKKLDTPMTLPQAIAEYQNTDLLTLDKDRKPTNLTVRDETDTMLYFMRCAYNDLPDLYTIYDKALNDHVKGDRFDKTTLQLQTRFSSWGSSGDKDGNKNVTAETTLEAIALHTKTALEMYSRDLEKLTDIQKLKDWKEIIDGKSVALNSILGEFKQLTEDEKASMSGTTPANAVELNTRFDVLSGKLAKIREGLDKDGAEKFTNDLKGAAPNNDDALALLRRFRTFGFSFGKIEYRETAEEYARVVEALLGDNYNSLPPEEKAKTLTEVLTTNPKTPAQFFADHKDEIIDGAGKKYSGDDAMPIAYHSLKRMALARDFPDMIENNVLAECGQLPKGVEPDADGKNVANQGVANLLEAQFLQRAVEQGGKRAEIGIIPLFEEADTIKNADKILDAAYKNEAHNAQLELLQERNGGNKTQQLQIAHSDNARRSGVQAARGFIHDAHKKLRKVGEENNIQTQFFEGGSISDMYRNGVRAISANVNAFGLHDFSKFTFQGGDLPNYFNHPESTLRILDRSIAHQASHLAGCCEEDRKPNNVIDDVAIAAMKRTYDDYKKNDFDGGETKDKTTGIVSYAKDNLHRLLALLDYKAWTEVGNAGSRAATRGSGEEVKEKPKLTLKNAIILGVGAIDSAGVDMRTIGFSMTQQVGGMLPTWVGSVNLAQYLNEEVADKYQELQNKWVSGDNNKFTDLETRKDELNPNEQKQFAQLADENEFLKELHPDANGKLTPEQINTIYKESPAFRDGQDKAAAGCLISDLDTTKKLMINHLKNFYIKNVDFGNVTDPEKQKEMALEAAADIINKYPYWKDKETEYKNAAILSYKALNEGGKQPNMDNFVNNKQIADKMRDCFKVATGNLLDDKFGYRDVLFNYRLSDDKLFDIDALADKAQLLTSRLWAAAIQMFSHGRWLPFSDPTYNKAQENGASIGRG